MTQQTAHDIYGILNDARGWRRVSEADHSNFIERTNADLIESYDGFGHFSSYYGGRKVESVVVKCPISQLKHIDDGALRAFIESQSAVALAS